MSTSNIDPVHFALALVVRAVMAGMSAAMLAPTPPGPVTTTIGPERRGFALLVVLSGLTAVAAVGPSSGAVSGSLGDWRWQMVFVSAPGALSGLGIWALRAHLGQLLSGHLADSNSDRLVILPMLIVPALVMASMSWAGANLRSALIAISLLGAVGWGLLASQQHRLVGVSLHTAPVVLGLNTSCTYLGVATPGVLGAIAIQTLDAHEHGYLDAGLILFAIVAAEWATLEINAAQCRDGGGVHFQN